jgi:hypothetical protein
MAAVHTEAPGNGPNRRRRGRRRRRKKKTEEEEEEGLCVAHRH